MKLDKAIEILTLMGTPDFEGHTEDILAARKLGTEALKRLLTMRSYGISQAILPLPGENPIPDLSPSAEAKQKLRESPLGTEPK